MTIEFNLDEFSEEGRKLLLMRANQWNCTPAQAVARLLDEAASPRRQRRRPAATVVPDEASADPDLSRRTVIKAPDGTETSTQDERRAA